MGIEAEDVERVRAASDIVAVVSQYTPLKRVGRSFSGICPFHAEKSPSFSVNPEKGLYYCFGCQAGGDVITFVREVEHTDFAGAVERLATKLGITLRYTEKDEGEAHRRRRRLLEAVERAVEVYHDRLLTGPDAGAARAYLRSRGFDGDAVRRYRLGWAPESWDTLAKALRLSDDDWRDAGLGGLNRNGRQYDHFRNRLLFPIFDASGRAIGFGGRILPGGDGPKYKNTPDCALYHKSRVLYGLNWAGAEAARLGEIVVCEGYTDVIAFQRSGVERAVATCGTALTEEHVRELTRYAKRVVLAFDADNAGQAAAAKFYAWERELDISVAVAALPQGVDPADLGREDPAALAASVTDARPFLEFRLERLFGAADLRSAEGRARAAEAAVVLVAEHPSDLVRDQYLMRIADRCQVDVARLRGRLAAGPLVSPAPARAPGRGGTSSNAPGERPGGRRGGIAVDPSPRRSDEPPAWDEAPPWDEEPPADWDEAPVDRRPTTAPRPGGRPVSLPVSPVERQALALLVHRPEVVVGVLEPVVFGPGARAAVDALAAAGGDLRLAVESASAVVADLLNRVAVEEPEEDELPTVAQLVVDAAKRTAAAVEAAARADLAQGDTPGWAERTRASTWLRQEADRLWALKEARQLARSELEPLVAWLTAYEASVASMEEEGRADG
jgi:DNA primase